MPFLQLQDRSLFFVRVAADARNEQTVSRPTFLFLHGLGSSHVFFWHVMSLLSTAGYDSVAFDMSGSGLSDVARVHQEPSINTICQDAVAILRHVELPLEQVIVVGHSMGGIVVSRLCSENKLKAAVLIGPVLPKPAMADIFVQRIKAVRNGGMEVMANSIPDAATGTAASPTHKAFIRGLLLAQNVEGYTHLCQTIAEAVRPVYSEADCPLAIVAGVEDKTSPLADSEIILLEWGSPEETKTLHKLDGVGHWHCIEAPEQVASCVLKLVQRL